MNNTFMIKKNYEFKRLFSKGKFVYGNNIHFYFLITNNSYNKFGIAISKKQGKAVSRNHIKRLIRENYKIIEKRIKTGVNILIVINNKKDIKDISFDDIKMDFENALKKADLLVG